MHFSLSDEEVMIRDTARRIAAERLAPVAARLDAGEGREEMLRNLGDLARNGFMTLNVAAEFGGVEAGTVAFALAVEEIGYACASTAVATSVTNMVGEVIQAVGSREQKECTCRASPTAPIRPAPSASRKAARGPIPAA
jgi:alkylation response protein AidB-like acyl-CoA dehydrogenase